MNRRIFALALAATAVACKEQPRRNADGSPALSYVAQDSLKVKDSVISEDPPACEQSAITATPQQRATDQRDRQDTRTSASRRAEGRRLKRRGDRSNAVEASIQSKVRVLPSRLNASEARVRKMRADELAHSKVDSEQVAVLPSTSARFRT